MNSDPESFLVRWSRRKRAADSEAARSAAAAVPESPAASPPATVSGVEVVSEVRVAAPVPADDPAAAPAVPLPPIESLDGLRSDYQAFFQQPVADELRRAALKKLFADPHFNQMDMLDVYVDDYTQFEPLPSALRMSLPSARAFLSDRERAALDAAEASPGTGNAAESGAATAGEDLEAATRPRDESDASVLTSDASADLSPPLTGAPDAAPADAPSPDDPNARADVSSVPAMPDHHST